MGWPVLWLRRFVLGALIGCLTASGCLASDPRSRAMTFSVWPSRHVIFSSDCAPLDSLESKLVYHKLLALTLYANKRQSVLRCLRRVAVRFPYYALYSLGANHVLLLAHNNQPIPLAHNPRYMASFIGNQRMFRQWHLSNNIYLSDALPWRWSDVGRFIPLGLLYQEGHHKGFVRSASFAHKRSIIFSQLLMSVVAGEPSDWLSASTQVLLSTDKHLSRIERLYALGIAMMANIRLQQARLALLLWDRYAKRLSHHHPLPIDLTILRQVALSSMASHSVPLSPQLGSKQPY